MSKDAVRYSNIFTLCASIIIIYVLLWCIQGFGWETWRKETTFKTSAQMGGTLNTWLLWLFSVSDIDRHLSCTDKIFHGSVKSDRGYYSKAMNETR